MHCTQLWAALKKVNRLALLYICLRLQKCPLGKSSYKCFRCHSFHIAIIFCRSALNPLILGTQARMRRRTSRWVPFSLVCIQWTGEWLATRLCIAIVTYISFLYHLHILPKNIPSRTAKHPHLIVQSTSISNENIVLASSQRFIFNLYNIYNMQFIQQTNMADIEATSEPSTSKSLVDMTSSVSMPSMMQHHHSMGHCIKYCNSAPSSSGIDALFSSSANDGIQSRGSVVLWKCCDCNAAGMTYALNKSCPECYHSCCSSCHVYYKKTR